MKIFNFILGALAIVLGIYSLFWPEVSFLNLGWIVALLLFLWGVCMLVTFIIDKKNNRKVGIENAGGGIAGLVASIVVIIFSILSLNSETIQGIFLIIILIAFTVFVLVRGISNIIAGFKKSTTAAGKSRVLCLIIGIIEVLFVLCAAGNIYAKVIIIETFISVMLIFVGVMLLISIFTPSDIDRFEDL